MRFLLDTHVLIWFYLDDPRLSPRAHSLIVDPANAIFASPVNHWEIAIKIKTGKYILAVPLSEFAKRAIHDNGFGIIPIEPAHSQIVTSLELHHRDPFDRMLVAQAMVEELAMISADEILDAYPITRIW